MNHTLKYRLACYKMLENFKAVLGVDTFFFFVSVMVDVSGYFLSSKATGNRHSYCIKTRGYFRQK